jgi:nitroreductase
MIRKSVRAYDVTKRLSEEHTTQLKDFLSKPENLQGPLNTSVRVQLVFTSEAKNEKLGTYGMISGATSFLCCLKTPATNMLDLGFIFERIVLFCTKLGLGTCWMAGFSFCAFLAVFYLLSLSIF